MERTSQVGLNETSNVDSPREVPAILKFKPPTFVLLPPKSAEPQESNHSYYFLRNLRSPSFFHRKNMFSLLKKTPFSLEKGKKPLLIWKKDIFYPFFTLSSSSPIYIAATTIPSTKVVAAVVTVVTVEAIAAKPSPSLNLMGQSSLVIAYFVHSLLLFLLSVIAVLVVVKDRVIPSLVV